MSSPVYNTQAYLDRLAVLNAAIYGVEGEPVLLGLFKNDVFPDANMTPDTFVPADYTAYAPVQVTMSAPTLNDQGLATSRSDLCEFSSAAGVDTQTVYGVYLLNDDANRVIAAQRFDVPQVMGGEFPQAVSGVWRYSDPLSTYGWIDVEG